MHIHLFYIDIHIEFTFIHHVDARDIQYATMNRHIIRYVHVTTLPSEECSFRYSATPTNQRLKKHEESDKVTSQWMTMIGGRARFCFFIAANCDPARELKKSTREESNGAVIANAYSTVL